MSWRWSHIVGATSRARIGPLAEKRADRTDAGTGSMPPLEIFPTDRLEVGAVGGTVAGLAVVVAVGAAVGTAVGMAAGAAVGTAVGTAVGLAVGTAVGAAVGPAVGVAAGVVGKVVGPGIATRVVASRALAEGRARIRTGL